MPDSIGVNSPKSLLARAHGLKNEEETRQLYTDWAQTYDETMIAGLGYVSPAKGAQLLAANLPGKNSTILDVGTGTGLVGSELKRLGFESIHGIDYSAPMLKVAEETGAYLRLWEADLNKPLELADYTYDALICIGTFTHGHVGAQCLGELFRILKPGGIFVTAIHKNYWESAGFAKKIDGLVSREVIKTISQKADSNYADSNETESWFIVWEKL